MLRYQEASNKKIAIFTTFVSADPAYSLNRVVQDQIKMFVMNGYKVKVIVGEGFQPVEMYAHEMVELATIPSVPCHNEVKKDESFDSDVDKLEAALDTVLKDVDVVLTHDIVYQPAALKHNFAARKVAKKYPNIKWLHWIHSATAPYSLSLLMNIFDTSYTDLVKQEFPNSFYVFFNDYSKPRIAKNFGVDEHLVKTIHHPIDIAGFLELDPQTEQLAEEKGLFTADVVVAYPCRLDRGKQVEHVIKTMSQIKSCFDMSVRVIVVDFHSTGGDKVVYRDQLKNIAIDWGLNAQELTFTSEVCPEWQVQTPHKIVRDLMLISNVFIMPSVSESYSLVTQEAALTNHVVVLNFDFPPFRDIFGENAIFRKYSSNIDLMNGMDGNTVTAYGPNQASDQERKAHERLYHKETAGMIVYRLRNYQNVALQTFVRQNRNLSTVFKKEIEPLLFS